MKAETVRRLEWIGLYVFGGVALLLGWFCWLVWGDTNAGFGGILVLFAAPLALIAAAFAGACLYGLILGGRSRPSSTLPEGKGRISK